MISLEPWELARAQKFADDSKRVLTEGTAGAESLAPLVTPDKIAGTDDATLRRAAYGLFPAIGVVEPWFSDLSFRNNWVSDTSSFSPPWSVMVDPFGFVHWRGLAIKTSGVASNGEEMCRFPLRYAPKLPRGYPCITNAGIIHIAVFSGSDYGFMTWRTTGGFTGGYGYVYIDNLQPYDTRD